MLVERCKRQSLLVSFITVSKVVFPDPTHVETHARIYENSPSNVDATSAPTQSISFLSLSSADPSIAASIGKAHKLTAKSASEKLPQR